MKLPNAHRAFVDPAKIRDYLLAFDHSVGRYKAAVFATAGYQRRNWPRLHAAIESIAQTGGVSPATTSVFGQKYEVRAILHGPSGRPLSIVTVWIIRRDEDFPRFITAYPGALR